MKTSKTSLTLYSLALPLILAVLALAGAGTYVYTKNVGGGEPLDFKFSNNSETTENKNTNRAGKDIYKVSVTEAQINLMLQQEAIGKSFKGYTLTSGSVDVTASGVILVGTLNDVVAVEIEAGLNEAGTDIVVSDVVLDNAGSFEGVKEGLLKFVVNGSIDKYLGGYKGKLDHIELAEGSIDIFLFK